MDFKKCFNDCVNILDKCTPNAKQECIFLCEELLHISSAEFYYKTDISLRDALKLKWACIKRSKGVPFQLVVGYSDFYGVKIKESKFTLKPRPETEILVDIIANKEDHSLKVLDMCSGSGCIGLALNKAGFKNVTLCDISSKAIKQCKINARLNNLNVDIIKSDMFERVSEKYDIIVCNPPYIKTDDIKSLTTEVKKYDPFIALDGGLDGLKFYKILALNASKFLNDHGVIYLEIGLNQENDIIKLLQNNFKSITIIKDYNNINRFIRAEKC